MALRETQTNRKEAEFYMGGILGELSRTGSIDIVNLLIMAFCVFLSLSIHEFSHGYAAYKIGDDTAKNMGRLNLSPLSHLDPVGAICLFLFGFGWAKPVPVNPRNFGQRKYKLGMVLTSIAGPLSNLLLAVVSALIYMVLLLIVGDMQIEMGGLAWNALKVTFSLLDSLMIMNISLAIFNLLPVPPLDGSKILNAVLPARIYFKIMRYEQYGFIILLLIINFAPFKRLLFFLVEGVYSFLWEIIFMVV